MNVQLLSDALGAINVKYIDEVLTYQPLAKRRPAHIGLKRCIAACLAVVLCFGSFIAVNAEARAAFVGWIKEIYTTYFVYHYESEANVDAKPADYRPTWLPDGYSEFRVNESEKRVMVAYSDESGKIMRFNYIDNPSETDWFIDISQLTVEQITLNGNQAELFIAEDPTVANGIAWTAEDNTAFYISAFLDAETLIKVAESVTATDY